MDQCMFVPYSTMFKVEYRPHYDMISDGTGRMLQCVACNALMEWRIYTLAPEKFDTECPMCHVKAGNFWEGKLHKELNADA